MARPDSLRTAARSPYEKLRRRILASMIVAPSVPFAMVLLCIFLVPFFRSRNVLTPYELLEERFGPITRTLASLIFLCSRCLALGAVIYAPAVALSAMSYRTWSFSPDCFTIRSA